MRAKFIQLLKLYVSNCRSLYLLNFTTSNVSPFAMENVDIYVIEALLWLKTNNAALNQGKNQRCYQATNAYV